MSDWQLGTLIFSKLEPEVLPCVFQCLLCPTTDRTVHFFLVKTNANVALILIENLKMRIKCNRYVFLLFFIALTGPVVIVTRAGVREEIQHIPPGTNTLRHKKESMVALAKDAMRQPRHMKQNELLSLAPCKPLRDLQIRVQVTFAR